MWLDNKIKERRGYLERLKRSDRGSRECRVSKMLEVNREINKLKSKRGEL